MLTVNDHLAWPAAPADQRIAYGPHPAQFGDLYLPAGTGPHPLLILIHGGCWQTRFDLAPLSPLCLALRTAGWAVWNLEYRRLDAGAIEARTCLPCSAPFWRPDPLPIKGGLALAALADLTAAAEPYQLRLMPSQSLKQHLHSSTPPPWAVSRCGAVELSS